MKQLLRTVRKIVNFSSPPIKVFALFLCRLLSFSVLFCLPPPVPVFFSFFCSHHLSLPLPLSIYTQSLEHKIPQRHAFPCQNTQALSPRKKFLPYIIHQRGALVSEARIVMQGWRWSCSPTHTNTHTHTLK